MALGGGAFLVSAATLMDEILLTRIFSVTLWYHFAFMAISVAMLGSAVGAVAVYAAPLVFRVERAIVALTWTTLLFGASLLVTFVVYARSTLFLAQMDRLSSALISLALVSLPFVFGGMSLCIVLTKFPLRIAFLYAADLTGAATGSIAVVAVLNLVDAPTAMVAAAFLTTLAALAFATSGGSRKLFLSAVVAVVCFGVLLGISVDASRRGRPLIRLRAVKGEPEGPALYEKWNSFSRVRVEGEPDRLRRPFGWGLSPAFDPKPVRELTITIDAASGTVMTGFDGDLSAVDHLRYDVSNIAHWLRPDADVLVVGTGGDRDVLSALTFKQPRIVGLEINQAILQAANVVFGGFTGHLDRFAGVTFVNDEARSYLERTPSRHDIIQITLIDTWAATSAGAFALTENSLYTVEAWDLFLNRLSDRGVLSVSRWYRPGRPYELYRLVSLAATTLRRRGVRVPGDHLLLVKSRSADTEAVDVATLLVGREAFGSTDIALAEQVSSRMGFEIVLGPRSASEPIVAELVSSQNPEHLLKESPTDISAPTDDRPFFFNLIRVRDALRHVPHGADAAASAARALLVLWAALTLLTIAGLIVPLRVTAGPTGSASRAIVAFFAAIGLGFMLIEVAQMQRFSLFLGHPTYAMVVALPTLLLSSGLGSYSLRTRMDAGGRNEGTRRLALLTATVLASGALTPSILRAASSLPMGPRIAVCIVVLAVPGFLMGMAFPVGIRRAHVDLLPWLWGINGAASVCATVAAMILSTTVGISATFWTGGASYGVALAAYWIDSRSRRLAAQLQPAR